MLQAAVCAALVILLSVSAVDIFHEGSARKAENPMESVYTPEAVAARFAPIAPLLFAGVGLLAAGLALGVKDEKAEKPVKDAVFQRNLLVSRTAKPSAAMRAEQRRQKKLLWAGWGVFALCMVPILAYLLNPDHFPEADLEGMFFGLLRVFLPWTLVGLGALAGTSKLREKSILRETEAAREQLKREEAEGVPARSAAAQPPRKTAVLQTVLLAIAIVFIVAGILNGSALDVLYKAITLCTECVGLG